MKNGILVTKLNQLKLSDDERQMALCALIAYSLPMPDMQAESLTQLYLHRHKATVDKLLSDINEIMLIDLSEMMVLTQRLYIYRVQACYNPLAIMKSPVNLLEVSDTPLGDINELMEMIREAVGSQASVPMAHDIVTVTSPI